MNQSLPETIAGRYRVVGRLGQGGMGSVYEAVDDKGVHVAVKVIMTELANNKTLVGRFEREARAAAAIDTPHITRTLDTGTDPLTGLPYLVMELLEGDDLSKLLDDLGPLPADVALRIAAQACIALQKAHEARVLHRDIKPANLFIARQPGGRIVKLLDFGVAKVRPEVSRSNAETAGLTRTGSMLGSPLYMSPEQARGYKDIDFRSDLWSLGVVLYKMLSGRTPHDDTEELGELIVMICTEPPAPIQDVAPWVPPEIAAVVHRALRFSPNERHASAAELYAAIMAFLPNGYGITDAMLFPMTEAEKSVIAPRLATDLTDAPPPRRTGQTTGTGATSVPGAVRAAPSQGANREMDTDVTLAISRQTPMGAGTGGGLSPSGGGYPQGVPPHYSGPHSPASGAVTGPGGAMSVTGAPVSTLSGGALGTSVVPYGGPVSSQSPPPRTSPSPWLLVAGLGIFIGAGAGVLRFTGLLGGAPDPAPATTQSAAADTKPRSVTVVILPPTATVEVEGKETALVEGILEISGPVGSVHKVRVASGGVEKNVRVVVSESGAVPPKIELEGAAVPATGATATAHAPTGPGIKPRPKPTTTPVDPLRNKR